MPEDKGQELTVDDDGYIAFTPTHCSVYVIGEFSESDGDLLDMYFFEGYEGTAITLTAEYSIITYFVEFEYNDEPAVSPEPEFCFDVKDDPIREFPSGDEIQGYEFAGWQIKVATVIFDVETLGDLFDYLYLAVGEYEGYYLTLTAKYDPIVYTVNFVNDKDETLMDSETFTVELEEPIIFGNAPSLPGYTFEGWFIILEDEDEVSINSSQDLLNYLFHSEGYDGYNTVTLTARYEPIIYTIEFEPREGVFDEGVSGVIEGLVYNETFSLPDVSREGYTFMGWFIDNKEINPETFWSDIDHTVNEIKIYAKWQSPDAKDIADGKLVVEIIGDGFTYTGETIAPSVKVWYDEILFGLNDDYTISYGDNINVATGGTIIIFGQDGYKGEFTESFAIKPKSIETAIITVDPKSDLTYTGNGVEPGITVTLDDNAFDAVNYTVEYLNNVNVGTAIVKIIAKNGNYTGTVTESFVITAKTVIVTPESGQSKVYGEADPVLTYLLDDGNAYEFIDGNTSLVRADGNNVNTYKISQGTLAFREGTANYILVFSDVTVTFEITAKDVNAAEFTWDYTEEFVFDNTPKTVALTNIPVGLEVVYTNASMTDAESYAATAVFKDNANYNIIGNIPSLDWKIVPATVILTPNDAQSGEYGSIPALTYTLSKDVSVTGAPALVYDEDYNVGSYAIILGNLESADSNYVIVLNSEVVEFRIIPKKVHVIIEDQTAVYTGNEPSVDYTLSEDVDVTGKLSMGNVYDASVYSIAIGTLAVGTNYELVMPENTATFTITAKSISDANVDVKDVIYDGKAKTPAFTVRIDGETLTAADYTASYHQNTDVGTASIVIEGKGNYEGVITREFAIKPVDVFIGDAIIEEDKPKVEINETVAGEGIPDTVFQELSGEGKTLVIDVVDEDGAVLYSWTFEGEYEEGKEMDFKASITFEEPDEDLNGLLEGAGVDKSILLKFAASGEFPMTTSVRYYVGNEFESGTMLSLYFFNTESNKLEELGQFEVDRNGYVTFALEHCSYYVLGELFDSDDGGAGAGSNYTLYIGAAVALIAAIVAIVFMMKRRG